MFVISSAGPGETTFRAAVDVFGPGDELVELIGGAWAQVESAGGESRVTLSAPSQGVAVWSWRTHTPFLL